MTHCWGRGHMETTPQNRFLLGLCRGTCKVCMAIVCSEALANATQESVSEEELEQACPCWLDPSHTTAHQSEKCSILTENPRSVFEIWRLQWLEGYSALGAQCSEDPRILFGSFTKALMESKLMSFDWRMICTPSGSCSCLFTCGADLKNLFANTSAWFFLLK